MLLHQGLRGSVSLSARALACRFLARRLAATFLRCGLAAAFFRRGLSACARAFLRSALLACGLAAAAAFLRGAAFLLVDGRPGTLLRGLLRDAFALVAFFDLARLAFLAAGIARFV